MLSVATGVAAADFCCCYCTCCCCCDVVAAADAVVAVGTAADAGHVSAAAVVAMVVWQQFLPSLWLCCVRVQTTKLLHLENTAAAAATAAAPGLNQCGSSLHVRGCHA